MFTCICSSEGKAARVTITLVHNAVVIVKGLVNGNLDFQAVINVVGVGIGVDEIGRVGAYPDPRFSN